MKTNIITTIVVASALIVAFTNNDTFRNKKDRDDKENVIYKKLPEIQDTANLTTNYLPDKDYEKIISNYTIPITDKELVIGMGIDGNIDNPADNEVRFVINEEIPIDREIYLEYDLYGFKDYQSVCRVINEGIATGGEVLQINNEWTHQQELITSNQLKQGINIIRFSIPKDIKLSYHIKNIKLKIGEQIDEEVIIANEGDCNRYGEYTYINGYIIKNADIVDKVLANGKELRYFDGCFSGITKLANERTDNVMIEVKYKDGESAEKIITIKNDETYDYVYSREALSYTSKMADINSSFQLGIDGISIEAEQGFIDKTAKITIIGLEEIEMPMLGADMVNVTAKHSGYRCLPHGSIFTKDLEMRLGYDEAAIPAGYGPEDIRTFYYDDQVGNWVALDMDSIDTENKEIISKTGHFTDFINAIIKAPELPTMQAFTPTMMKDMKFADPMAGVNVISPPKANNSGTTNLSFPFQIPAGRGGMQPQLALSYNSEGGNGWIGVGWNIQIPAITVETRWGVPRYDGAQETEEYLINGEQIVEIELDPNSGDTIRYPLGHMTNTYRNRNSGDSKYYSYRVEGAFHKIIRHGNAPTNYWWEVIDKQGTHYYYGKYSNDGGVNNNCILSGNNGIAYWALSEVRDVYGNTIKYHYNVTQNPGKQIYISQIAYTGYDNSDGPYTINFYKKARTGDIFTSARYGFLERTDQLLDYIVIKYDGQFIRKYYFVYESGAYNKNLLKSIVDITDENFPLDGLLRNINEFCVGKNYNIYAGAKVHCFDYYREQNIGFSANSKTIYSPIEAVEKLFEGIFNEGNYEPLSIGRTIGKTVTVGGSIGLGIGPKITSKINSIQGNYSETFSSLIDKVQLIDLNGDGIIDKLVRRDNKYFFHKGTINNNGEVNFNHNGVQLSLPTLGISCSEGNSKGIELFFGFKDSTSATATYSNIKTEELNSNYFADINGDGYIDYIRNGNVFFNFPNSDSIPQFTLNQNNNTVIQSADDTCYVIHYDGELDSTVVMDTTETMENIVIQRDPVKMWIAPDYYNDHIIINSQIQRINPNSDNSVIYYYIQHNNTIIMQDSIMPTDTSMHVYNSNCLYINANDRIYFRMHSKDGGQLNDIHWDPEIKFIHKECIFLYPNTRDADEKHNYKFKYSEDAIIHDKQFFIAPDTGTVEIDVSISSPAQSDSMRFQILHNDTYLVNNGYIDAQPYSYVDTIYRNVLSGDSIFFKLNSNTNVNWNDIDFYARIKYIDGTDNYDIDSGIIVPLDPPIRSSSINSGADYVYYPSLHMSIYPRIKQHSEPIYLDRGRYSIMPQLSFNGGQLNGPSGSIYFTIKTKRNLIAMNRLSVFHGIIMNLHPEIQILLQEPDTVYIDYFTTNIGLADALNHSYCKINDQYNYTTGFYSAYPDSLSIYGNLYRGWGQFSYYGNSNLIDQSELSIDPNMLDTSEWDEFPFQDMEDNIDNWSLNTMDSIFMANTNNIIDTSILQNIYNFPIVPMWANREEDKWEDIYRSAYCEYTTMGFKTLKQSIYSLFINSDTNVTQLDEEDIPVFGSVIPGGPDNIYNTKVIYKKSKQYTNSISVKASLIGGACFTKTRSETESFGYTDFMDFNGDRFPDIINEGKIQYTNSHGGLSNLIYNTGHKYTNYSNAKALGVSYAVTGVIMSGTSSSNGSKSKLDNIKGNFGINDMLGNNNIQYMYVDVNGDGLPDRVNRENHTIKLNVGYSLLNPNNNNFILNVDTLNKNNSASVSINLGVNIGNYSFSAGIGGSLNISNNKYNLMDVNNDGMVDIVYIKNNKIKVYINNGTSFQDYYSCNTLVNSNSIPLSLNKTYNIGGNGSFTIGGKIFPLIKLTGTPYADLSYNLTTDRARLTDINGDGFIDYIYINDLGETKVNYGIPQKTNILKEVKTPTGAKYFCNYELKYPEKDNPSSKWVLASLKVYDGFVGDGADTTYYKFKYDKPKYHRMERESFGYETVTTEQYNNSNHIYRVVIEKYHNQDFLFKGLKKYEVNYDGMAQKYVETEYKWDKKEITTGKVVIDSLITCFGPYYPAISMETKRYFEGNASPSIITKKLYIHGQYGNVIRYENRYDSSYIEDELIADIHYSNDINQHFLEMADEIKVYDYQNQMIQHREASYNSYGKMSQMRVFNNTDIAYTDLVYDQYGNVILIQYPEDVNGDRLKLEYEYDQLLHTYPARITDFWGNSLTTDYDFRLGLPTKVQDPSGNFVFYEYYEDGKLNTVTAPNEISSGAPYTIKCDYWTNHNASLSNNTGIWAQTLHYDSMNDGNEFETVTISDGLGRAIQVKKKSTIYGVDSVVVSGKIIFDKLGRQEQVYQPETEVYNGAINHNYSNLSWQNPTTYSYDILDRPRLQNNPDGTHIIYSYDFGTDNFGKTCFKTNITDPNGKVTEQYKDARGLQTTVVAPMNTITSFIYTSLGQIKTSIDPEYNNTNYSYDMLGRLIEREHPDAGITQYDYDMAGNIIKKMSENSDIEYRYQEGRLANIHYPGNEEMDVYYEYGAPGTGNQSGRLIKQQDASGVQTFWYGNMGELIGNKHTYVVPGGEAYSFEMRWQYDSWNRLRLIQYPDGETVNYYYDNGGKLMRMNGAKFGNEYNYINRIFYDKYDSRVHIDYGNSTYSDYSYDPLNRRLINLKSYNHSGLKMQDIVYIYDGVGNIMHQFNNGEYVDGEVGGPYNYNYQYDDLYRLIGAGGAFISYQFGNIGYNMAMSYSPSGNITNKQINGQTLINGGVNNINYNRDYFYDSRPHQVTISGENTYEWDSNGNMIGRRTPQGIRSQCWDNEDRLTAVNDMGSMPQLSAYLYDGGGERVWKLTGGVMQNYMNGQQIYNSVHLDKTLYASPYMVMTEQEYTKHYYIEGERICSKIGGGFQWAHTPPTSTPIDFIADDPHACSMHLRDMVDRNTQCAEYDGEMDIRPELAPAYNNGNNYENLQYFYHPDHLGSASFVTNAEGAVMQHLQYLPYGELFVSQRNSDEFDSRYKFTAKELDNETSYTYFGARYYDSELSGWLSVDPMSDERRWVSPYAYCQWNPLILVDPSGMLDDWYRDDETGATFWHEGSENFIEKDGVRYRNIGETHSTYSNGKRIDYKQNNVVNIVDVDPNLNLEGGQYIPQQFTTDNGQKVNVSFSSSSNNAISSDVVSGLIKSINEANNSDANITSINISSTTNHPSNATRSAHTVENGARAIDISRINNVPVSKTDPYSHALQQAIGRVPGWLENYGPSIIQKMYNGAAISAPWAREIKGGHYDHIHYSVPRR